MTYIYRKTPIVAGIVFCLFSIVFAYSGGTGEPNNPYQITTVSDWNDLMNTSADWNKCFFMTADVDLQGVALTPVGNYSTNFTGIFDGNSHIIRNANINNPSSDNIGLFGYVGSGGQIRNLGAESVNIIGQYYVGGLIGVSRDCNITNCYSSGTIEGTDTTGGLVGESINCNITNCGSNTSVGGLQSVGGLIGNNSDSNITNSYSKGSVFGDDYIGGLAGINDGYLNNCYSMSSVNGYWSDVGGLVGFNYWTISNCYSTGDVSISGEGQVGGLVGMNFGVVYSSFWDVNTSGQMTSANGRGLTTSQMKSAAIYQNAGWGDNGWVINDGLDYPHFEWENSSGIPISQSQTLPLFGSGTEQDPYQVWTAEDFALLNWYFIILDKHVALMADIDLTGIELYPISEMGVFTGVFEGNGHCIRNAHINNPFNRPVGLFGFVFDGGQIRNLGVEDVNIIGQDYVGGLAGVNRGTISACYTTGFVYGSHAGGLAGLQNNIGNTYNSYSICSVSGSTVGGLVGINQGNVSACYAAGTVSGGNPGGLIGSNNNGNVMSSFWDVNTSGLISDGGEGKTTEQMQDINTFLQADWDFLGEIDNGTDDIWRMCANGIYYPKLFFQFPAGDFGCPDGIGFEDLLVLCEQWLLEKLSADIEKDGIVNFFDYAVFTNNWQGDMAQLADFSSQWLKSSDYRADIDIAPAGGDGTVNMLDFAVFADNWLQHP